MAKKTNQTMIVNTVIGAGTEFVGDLNTKDTARIDGVIRGNIQSEGTVIIGTNGRVDLTCLLRNLYAGQEATVRTGHGTTTGSK